jgi:hypothetical protein
MTADLLWPVLGVVGLVLGIFFLLWVRRFFFLVRRERVARSYNVPIRARTGGRKRRQDGAVPWGKAMRRAWRRM